jgi:hypothetical protein
MEVECASVEAEVRVWSSLPKGLLESERLIEGQYVVEVTAGQQRDGAFGRHRNTVHSPE